MLEHTGYGLRNIEYFSILSQRDLIQGCMGVKRIIQSCAYFLLTMAEIFLHGDIMHYRQ